MTLNMLEDSKKKESIRKNNERNRALD